MSTGIEFYTFRHDQYDQHVDQAYLLLAREFFPNEPLSSTIDPSLARILVDSDIDHAIELDPCMVVAVDTNPRQEATCGALLFSKKASVLARHVIHYLVIDENYRGSGLGSELLRQGELAMASRGLYRIMLHARRGTEAFYQNQGYRKLAPNKWEKRHIKNLSPFS